MTHRRLPGLGLALAALLTACSTAPSPSPEPVASATPTPAATTPASEPAPTDAASPTPVDTGSAGTPPCDVSDLKASHGIVEGAAGSLVTEVIVVAAVTCSIDAFPTLVLRDAAGASMVGGALGPGAIDLVGGVAYSSQVRLANWCIAPPTFPVALELLVDGTPLPVTGGSFPEEGVLPPCNGSGSPILEGSAWLPAP